MDDHLAFRTSYHGAEFQGSQSQTHGQTVQDRFESCLKVLFRQKIRLQFTSRTDSGVHAYDQIFYIRNGMALLGRESDKFRRRFRLAINSLLKGSAVVWEIGKIKSEFNPKTDVKWKEYRYRIFQSLYPDPLMDSRTWWVRKEINFQKLEQGLRACEGDHDFFGLSKIASSRKRVGIKGTRRNILETQVLKKKHPRFSDAYLYDIRIRGEGFLHQMARTIVGTAVDIATGENLSFEEVLESKDRNRAGRAAPAGGLILHRTKIRNGLYTRL